MSNEKLIERELKMINLKLNNIESPYVKEIERSLENIAENLATLLLFTFAFSFVIFSLLVVSMWHFW